MACNNAALAGLVNQCDSSRGGIKRAVIAPYIEGAFTEAEGKLSQAEGKTPEWHDYYFKPNSGSLTQTLTTAPENGVSYVTSNLALVFSKMDTVKRLEMTALCSQDTMAVVQDSNGVWWVLGADEPCVATAADGQTGTAKGDGNRYTLTLTSDSGTFLKEASAELISTLPSQTV